MDLAAALLLVLTPLCAVPLTVIVFYLRSLREHQTGWQTDATRRYESLEGQVVMLRAKVDEFERDYTAKEEWLRECMHARRRLELLTEATARIEALMQSAQGLTHPASRIGRDRFGEGCE